MTTRSERRREARAERRAAASRPRGRGLRLVPLAIAGLVLVLVGAYVFGARTSASPEERAAAAVQESAAEDLATANAGGAVRKYSGTHHTVFHSTVPLPDGRVAAPDARPTLVWFSGTWCEYCEQMEPFAHETAAALNDRVRFVEKSVDHDRSAASRYGVRGTPTFVLIDAAGREVSRFFFQPSPQAFTAAIEAALRRAG